MFKRVDCPVSDSRLDLFRDLKHPKLNDYFIAEGRLVVERLLQSDYQTEILMVAKRRAAWAEEFLQRSDIAFAGTVLFVEDKQVDSIVGFDFHSGIMAAGMRNTNQQQADLTISKWLQLNTHADRPTVFAILPHIALAENLGAVIRTAWGLGCSGLIVDQRGADPLGRRTLRVSMGHALSLPIYRCSANDDQLITELKENQVALTAIEVDDRMVPLRQAKQFPVHALIFGNEIDGVPEKWIQAADQIAGIPMAHSIDSLNVAASFAIAAHHFCNAPVL